MATVGSRTPAKAAAALARCRGLGAGGVRPQPGGSGLAPRAAAAAAAPVRLQALATHDGCGFGARRRCFAALAGPSSDSILAKVRQSAVDMGYNPDEVYEPWLPVDAAQQALLALTGTFGDGALAIAGAALLLRLVSWPWNARALQRQCDRIELLPVFMDLQKVIESCRRRRGGGAAAAGGAGNSGAVVAQTAREAEKVEAELMQAATQLQHFVETTKFSPMQGMGYQFGCVMPLYFLGYCALGGMAGHPEAFFRFVSAPTLWLDSLVLPDPYGVLPVVSALAVLANAEVNGPPIRKGQEENAAYMKLVVRGAMLTFVPMTAVLPAGMLIFMSVNAAYTAGITWLFRRYLWKRPYINPQWLISPR
eukprot:TRINITY_DN5486_c1_g8_i1.p1 TRINITY_DN5486_c1_g8~~TRINITY_DN5486_c1_g8_i1.p1  ORF type:complete len:377 (+),score=80.16 TRINITY_DN5486_c1_g8_i1:37-1131(+)